MWRRGCAWTRVGWGQRGPLRDGNQQSDDDDALSLSRVGVVGSGSGIPSCVCVGLSCVLEL